MGAHTSPSVPVVDGAVTLQAAIDAREGDRLPLELALYISGEVGRQVERLHALGKGVAALDPKRVWCTRQGAVFVPETSSARPEGEGLARLVYRLLSGSGEVSAWPPSYFNPGVEASLDEAVMAAVDAEAPEKTEAMVAVLSAAASRLEANASIDGMARLVLAVPDDEPAPVAIARRPPTLLELIVARPFEWRPFLREQWAPLAVATLVVLFAAMVLSGFAGREVAPLPPIAAPVATIGTPEPTLVAQAQKPRVTAAKPKPAAVRKLKRKS